MNNDYERLLEENKKLQEGFNQKPNSSNGGILNRIGLDDEDLKEELGEKYEELGEMVNALKDNLKRVN